MLPEPCLNPPENRSAVTDRPVRLERVDPPPTPRVTTIVERAHDERAAVQTDPLRIPIVPIPPLSITEPSTGRPWT
jgi:hypothetical protein